MAKAETLLNSHNVWSRKLYIYDGIFVYLALLKTTEARQDKNAQGMCEYRIPLFFMPNLNTSLHRIANYQLIHVMQSINIWQNHDIYKSVD